MSLLERLLDTLASVRGPVRIEDLARHLGVESSALDGMLDVLQRKGLLERPPGVGGPESMACAPGCGSSCAGLDACAFVAGVPSAQPLVVTVRSDSGLSPSR